MVMGSPPWRTISRSISAMSSFSRTPTLAWAISTSMALPMMSADFFYPILRQAPPFDFIGAAHHGRDLAFERQHGADLGLCAADLRHVARVAPELVPVTFVGQTDERVETGRAHCLAEKIPATVS